MKKFFPNAEELWSIRIKYKGNTYLTLYGGWNYDSVLHNDSSILYFRSTGDMKLFCEKNGFRVDDDIWEYDFEAPIENPVDYRRILENWNLLNTIAKDFGMFFEGDGKKYNALYDLLFRLNTPVDPIPPTYDMSEKYYQYILKVFRKKDRFLRRLELYEEKYPMRKGDPSHDERLQDTTLAGESRTKKATEEIGNN